MTFTRAEIATLQAGLLLLKSVGVVPHQLVMILSSDPAPTEDSTLDLLLDTTNIEELSMKCAGLTGVVVDIVPEPMDNGFQANARGGLGWARGDSVDEAVGNLVRYHNGNFGVEFVYDDVGLQKQYERRARKVKA